MSSRPLGTGVCLHYGPPKSASERDRLPRNNWTDEENTRHRDEYGPSSFSFEELVVAVHKTQGHFAGATAHNTFPKNQPFAFASGCFRDSMRAVDRGSHSIPFWLMHGRRFTIGSTGDKAIAFVDFQHALHVRLLPTKSGRYAQEVLARLPSLRELSVGFRILGWDVEDTPFGPVSMIRKALLMELSAVDAGGMPRTSLTLFRAPKVMPAHVWLERERTKSPVLN